MEPFLTPPEGFSLEVIPVSGSPFAYFYAPGEGPPLVFLHGFPDTPHLWFPLITRLGKGWRPYYLVWLRGYPPSGPPPRRDYTLANLVADLKEFLTQLGSGPVDLVGHDWGGILGYGLGAVYPEILRRLVAISVPPVFLYLRNLWRNGKQFYRSRYIGFFQLPWIPELRIRRTPYIAALIREWSPHYPSPEQLDMRVRYFQEGGATTGALRYYRDLFWSGLFRHPLSYLRTLAQLPRKVRVPTLILTGDRDGGIGIEAFSAFAELFPQGVTLEIFPDRGHFLPLESPEEVASRVKAFLSPTEGSL